MSDIDWDDLITSYRTSVDAGAQPVRAIRAYLQRKGIVADAVRFEQIRTELDHRLEPPPEPVATLPPSIPRDLEFVRVPDAVLRDPPDPAPNPPPPPSAPQAEPAALSLPELAPSARQEPAMSLVPAGPAARSQILELVSSALSALLRARGLDAAAGLVAELVKIVEGVLRLAAQLKRRGQPDAPARIDALCDDATAAACSAIAEAGLPEDGEIAATVGEIVRAAVDAATDAELTEDQGELFGRGIVSILRVVSDLAERDPGNLRARALRAEQNGRTKRAARLRAAAERIEARG